MREGEPVEAGNEGLGLQPGTNVVYCIECASSSGLKSRGWRAYRVDDPETDEGPTLAFYCPTCAGREFGYSRRV